MTNDWWIPAVIASGIFLVFVLLMLGRAYAIVNILAVLLVGSAIVVGVLQLREEPSEASCQPPDSPAPSDVRQARDSDRDSLSDAVDALRRARSQAESDPSLVNTRGVREAERTLRLARDRWRLWRPAEVTVSETANTSFKLGHDLNGGVRTIAFSANQRIPGPRYLDVHVNPFAGEDAGQELKSPDIAAWAELQPGRQHGTLFLCIPSDRRMDVPSGQFGGELVLETGRVQHIAVPVTLSVPDSNLTTVMLVALATLLAASWYVFFLRREHLSELILYGTALSADNAVAAVQMDDASRVLRWPFGFWHGYWRWICSVSGAITIVAGTVTAVAAFSTAYLTSDTWAGSLRDWLTLLGAVATAFVAGGTAGKLAQLTPENTNTNTNTNNGPG